MCKSIAEGGMRCAAHTRPAYAAKLAELRSVTEITQEDHAAFTEAARAYAATPTGSKAVAADIEALADSNPDLSEALRAAATQGAQDYRDAKEAVKNLEQEATRAEVISWANEVPEDPYAREKYIQMVAKDLSLDPETLDLMVAAQAYASENEPSVLEVGDLEAARFITVARDGSHVGTGTDPVSMRIIADMERMAAKARRSRREQLETVDGEGRRWVMYENESLSEVLQSVNYDADSQQLNVTLRPKTAVTGQPLFPNTPTHELEGPSYTYHDVSPSLVRALVSARSMGRFYAYVFSRLPQGGSLNGKTANDYSFAVHAANNMSPTQRATGPVPVKVPNNLLPA